MSIFAFLDQPKTEDELFHLRTSMLNEGEDFGITGFTCDDCSARWTCQYVFDLYNTDGDCLMEK